MNQYVEVLLRTLFAIGFLLLLCRIDGPKQVSQMHFYDYIVGITAGSIAAVLAVDRDVNIWYSIIGISLFMLSSLFFSILTNKSMFLRRVLSGRPIFLVAQGKINYKGLKRSHFDVNDLLRELRIQGYFDIGQINYAVLENNGHVSVMLKSASRPAASQEAGLTLPEDAIFANVIVDGKIIWGNLKAFNRDKNFLNNELKAQGADIKNVALGTLSNEGELSLYYKEGKKTPRSIFQ